MKRINTVNTSLRRFNPSKYFHRKMEKGIKVRLLIVANIVALFFACGSALANLDDTIVSFGSKKTFTERIAEKLTYDSLVNVMNVEGVEFVGFLVEARKYTYNKKNGWSSEYYVIPKVRVWGSYENVKFDGYCSSYQKITKYSDGQIDYEFVEGALLDNNDKLNTPKDLKIYDAFMKKSIKEIKSLKNITVARNL